MIFEFNATKTFTETLQIDDIGNCAIRCEGITREGKIAFPAEYYLITKTIMGKTGIIKFGPVLPDMSDMQNNFAVAYKVTTYKEQTIEREINIFINDGRKEITKAEAITEFEAFDAYPSIKDTFENL